MNNRSKNDDFIDVEKTPKKFQRSTSVGAKMGARGGAAANRNNGGMVRGDGLKGSKRAPQQTKFKRRAEKQNTDDSAPRKKKVKHFLSGF